MAFLLENQMPLAALEPSRQKLVLSVIEEYHGPIVAAIARCVSKASARRRGAFGARGYGAGRVRGGKDRGGDPSCKSRTRLSLGQKVEIVELLEQKVNHAEIARRFKCSMRLVSSCAGKREAIQAEAESAGGDASSKRKRTAGFPEMEKRVLALVEDAQKKSLPVTRGLITSFGLEVKNLLSAADTIAEKDRKKLKAFGASKKWAKNFLARNGIGATGTNVNPEVVGEGAEQEDIDQDPQSVGQGPMTEDTSEHAPVANGSGSSGGNKDGGGYGSTVPEGSFDPPPHFSQLSEYFGPLEDFAAACGNRNASYFLLKARMAFISAHVSN